MWCKKCGLLTAIKDAFMVSTDRLHTAHIPRHNIEVNTYIMSCVVQIYYKTTLKIISV